MKRIRRLIAFVVKLALVLVVAALLFLGYKNYQNLKKVHSYKSEIQQAVDQYNISGDLDLVMSIMLTESKGKGIDPMQSSESAFGQQNQFNDPKESIDQGVAYLAQAIYQAETLECDIWTAVQAYNFGLEYIDYVAEHGKRNTVQLAESYSKEVLSPMLGNDSEQTYRYWGWHSLFYNGGYLYHNGGNMFYAELVKFNEQKIRYTNFLF